MPRHRSIILLFLLLLLLTALAPAAPAAAAADLNTQTILTNLRSESYAVRQQATESLLADETLSPEDLQKLYAAATLPEQRQRLLAVAQHHFIRRAQEATTIPEGGKSMLGVSIALATDAQQIPEIGRPTIRITTTYPGYPAYVSLRPDDLIVSLNDQPLPPITDDEALHAKFIDQIKATPPGSVVRLGVFRDGKMLNVSIRLAGTNLELFYDRDTGALLPPYDAQWAQVRKDMINLVPAPAALKANLKATPSAAPEPVLHLNQETPNEPAGDE